jgi:hypothetical protein
MKFEDVTQDVNDILEKCRFPELSTAKILCIFSLKKKMRGGQLTLAWTKKANDFLRFLTFDDVTDGEGYDYFIFIDKKAWSLANEDDRIRLMRHELKHMDIDLEAKNPYKLRDHTVKDFYSEIEMNRDNPRWADSLATQTKIAYEEEKEEE